LAKRKNYSNTEKLAILCAQSASDKLAENTIILDLQKIDIAPCGIFVICDCKSTVQVRSVADNIINNIAEHSLRKPRTEGLETAEWVILDFFDVVVHIFTKELREYYKLEKLWADAKFYTVSEDAHFVETNYEDFKLETENSINENE
jgi:ribosome-associated protein